MLPFYIHTHQPVTVGFSGVSLPENFTGGRIYVHNQSKGQPAYVCEKSDFLQKSKPVKINFAKGGYFRPDFTYKSFSIFPLQTENLPVLPPPDRRREKVPEIHISDKVIGTPAAIYTEPGIILLQPSFNSLFQPFRLFVLLHEYGHFFYEDEINADKFALYHFIKKGGNAETAKSCLISLLKNAKNSQSSQRIQHISNYIA